MPIMFYDAHCPFCVRFQMALAKLMGPNPSLVFVPIQDPELSSQYPQLDPQLVSQDLHVLNERGEMLAGTAAVNYLLKLVPMAAQFIWLLDSAVGQKTVDYFYAQVKKRRELLNNRCGQCS